MTSSSYCMTSSSYFCYTPNNMSTYITHTGDHSSLSCCHSSPCKSSLASALAFFGVPAASLDHTMTQRLPSDPSADPPAINMPNLSDEQLTRVCQQMSDRIQETEAFLIEYDAYYQYEASDEEENKVVESCFSAPWQEVRHSTYTYWQDRILKDQATLKQLSEEIDRRVHGIEEQLNPVTQRALRVPTEVYNTFVFLEVRFLQGIRQAADAKGIQMPGSSAWKRLLYQRIRNRMRAWTTNLSHQTTSTTSVETDKDMSLQI